MQTHYVPSFIIAVDRSRFSLAVFIIAGDVAEFPRNRSS
jgi:hypothetical protein